MGSFTTTTMYVTRRLLRSTLSPSQCGTPTNSSSPNKPFIKPNAELGKHSNEELFDPKELYYGYQRIVDARDSKERWSEARILDLNESERLLFVHYIGWNSRYDEWVARERITAHGRHTKANRMPPESWDGKTSLFRRRSKRRPSKLPIQVEEQQNTDTVPVVLTSPCSPVQVQNHSEANGPVPTDKKQQAVQIEVDSVDEIQENKPKTSPIDLELTIDVHVDAIDTEKKTHKKAKTEFNRSQCPGSETESNTMEAYAIEGPSRTTKNHLAAIFRSRLQQSYRVEGYQMYMGPISPTESGLESYSMQHNPSYSSSIQVQSDNVYSCASFKGERINRMEQEAYHQQTLALRNKNLRSAVESEELLRKSSVLWQDQSHAFRMLDPAASPTNASTSSESSPKTQSTSQNSEVETGQISASKEKNGVEDSLATQKDCDESRNGKDEALQGEEDEILYEFVL
uniref:Uncharacterized protein AlNc14C106G6236 n=1 Tax=Albugo laibachii Nc14 TaxID=890382 RepID=F0WI29_9STRA|nr:conserved hypothetical protein [Albugo laibachii Nc14]|eukprot:CCA20907.1 conserved hypothetical protein [Albugo laibachii Nc14]